MLFISFNSMKVRLKLDNAYNDLGVANKFQFHEGPIKTALTGEPVDILISFNSMKVRLKQKLSRMKKVMKNVSIP